MTALYRHYDAEGVLLYVGIAECEKRRRVEHSKYSRWFGMVSKTEVVELPSRRLAECEEKLAIKIEKPLYNIVHNNDRQLFATDHLIGLLDRRRFTSWMYLYEKLGLASKRYVTKSHFHECAFVYCSKLFVRYLRILRARGFLDASHSDPACLAIFAEIFSQRYGLNKRSNLHAVLNAIRGKSKHRRDRWFLQYSGPGIDLFHALFPKSVWSKAGLQT